MDAKEKYAEVHSDWRNAMYELFIEDTDLYTKINRASIALATAAFDYGQEVGKSSN